MSTETGQSRSGRFVVGLGGFFAILFGLFVLLGLLGPLIPLLIQFVGLVVFGWAGYLGRVIPRITFNPEIAADAAIALGLALFGLHRILVWWTKQRRDQPAPWRFGWTVKIAILFLLLFATSLAVGGIVHQIAWLCREPKVIEMLGMGAQTKELSSLKYLGTGLKLYAVDNEGRFPKQLEELVPDYLPDYQLFFTVARDGDPPERVIYYPGYKDGDATDIIVLASPRPFESPTKRTRVVVHVDTSAMVIDEAKFQELIQKQKPAIAAP